MPRVIYERTATALIITLIITTLSSAYYLNNWQIRADIDIDANKNTISKMDSIIFKLNATLSKINTTLALINQDRTYINTKIDNNTKNILINRKIIEEK